MRRHGSRRAVLALLLAAGCAAAAGGGAPRAGGLGSSGACSRHAAPPDAMQPLQQHTTCQLASYGVALPGSCHATAEAAGLARHAGSSSSSSSTCQAQQQHDAVSSSASKPAAAAAAPAGSGSSAEPEQPWATFIVRFTHYRMLPELRASLESALSGLRPHWSWIDRANKAARLHPSDFALLSVSTPRLAELRAALAGVPGFRDVSPDRMIRGSAQWQPEGPLAAAFADAAPSSLRLLQEPAFGAQQQQQQGAAHHARQLLADGPPQPEQPQPEQPPPPSPAAQQQQQQQQQQEGSDERDSIWSVSKPPGRMSTRPTIGLDPANPSDREAGYNRDELRRRRRLLSWARSFFAGGGGDSGSSGGGAARRLAQADTRVTSMLQAPQLWKQGFSGKGIKVGVFDTGIREGHPHVRNIRERTNWTHQNSLSDGLGHGSFVAGVIASQDETCPGFAPDAELYTFKVFTDDQVSYTSWFLDAFNYAIASRLTIINLSIGGPDFLDAPFVDKVLEVTSNGLIMVSAIGNDGPLYGTLNNPADQPDVIGVGGIDNANGLAPFSSRGMTTWELPAGMGRVKPDVVAYGKDVTGSKITTGCRSLSGTSVASPVVAGAACLLASTLPEDRRWLLNPGSMKQALVEGAVRLPGLNLHEQGNGRIDLPASAGVLAAYAPRASLIPAALHLSDCPYMWPHCRQPLYAHALPLLLNATIVNGMAVTGRLESEPRFVPANAGGRLLHVTFGHSELLWPWAGYLAVYVEVSPAGADFRGRGAGNITFTVVSPPQPGQREPQRSTVVVPLSADIIPTPPRAQRLVWDVLHSVKYPPGYVPRDNLDIKSDVLDWHGDHPFTNFHGALNALTAAGYYVEVLPSPASCFDPANYAAYLLVDPEEEWYKEEVAALDKAVREAGMSLVLFAEWYHEESLRQMKFFDDNTRSWWTPVTGGANVPALNELLAPHGITLGERILQGVATLGSHRVTISYGTNIASFPAGGYLHVSNLNDAAGKASVAGDYAAFGVVRSGKGYVAVLGDANCLDNSHMTSSCYDFLLDLLATLLHSKDTGLLAPSKRLAAAYTAPGFAAPPRRRPDVNFTAYSWVLQQPLSCYRSAPCQFRDPPDCPSDAAWKATHLAPYDESRAPSPSPQPAAPPPDAAAPTRESHAVQPQPPAQGEQPQPPAQGEQPQPPAQEEEPERPAQAQGALPRFERTSMPRSTSAREEAAARQQRAKFVRQAMVVATLICVAGVVGVFAMWRSHVTGASSHSGGTSSGGAARKWAPKVGWGRSTAYERVRSAAV